MDTILQVATNWILPGLFFWLMFSLMAITIIEAIASLLKWREKSLEDAISLQLGDLLTKVFYAHNLVNPLEDRKPAYISSTLFAKVIMSWMLKKGEASKLNTGADSNTVIQYMEKNVSELSKDNPDLGNVLTTIMTEASIRTSNIIEMMNFIQADLENWFSETVSHMSSVYKKKIQITALVVGIVLAGVFNFDILSMTSHLWQMSLIKDYAGISETTSQEVQQTNLQAYIQLPLGWSKENTPAENDLAGMFVKFMGIYASGFLIAIGSQYSYDILRRQIKTVKG